MPIEQNEEFYLCFKSEKNCLSCFCDRPTEKDQLLSFIYRPTEKDNVILQRLMLKTKFHFTFCSFHHDHKAEATDRYTTTLTFPTPKIKSQLELALSRLDVVSAFQILQSMQTSQSTPQPMNWVLLTLRGYQKTCTNEGSKICCREQSEKNNETRYICPRK